MGMGIAFLPSLYIRSEIHRPSEVRVTGIHGEDIHRTHTLAWRTSSPARQLFREIAGETRTLAGKELTEDVTVVEQTSS
jgi:LysR family hydrogen peroxide-inducible transcriptional activator